jgi:hypothetical protein
MLFTLAPCARRRRQLEEKTGVSRLAIELDYTPATEMLWGLGERLTLQSLTPPRSSFRPTGLCRVPAPPPCRQNPRFSNLSATPHFAQQAGGQWSR